MKSRPTPKAGIENIKLYTPGKAGAGGGFMRKLSSNENLYGPSPKAKEAVREAAEKLWLYPPTDHAELRRAIHEVHGLDEERLICGGMGSDELLYLIAQAYAGEGDEIIMTEHGFEVYGIAANSVGADLVVAKETERRVDVDAILQCVTDKTKIVYIANPANPTGTMIAHEELVRLAYGLPATVLLVIDSAYAEFAKGYDGGASLAGALENVIMTRTFSKLYGLGGLRIGWAYGARHIIDTLNRIRIPFNLSAPALAGAEAAMRDQDYALETARKICEDREYLRGVLQQLGIEVDQSYTNFVLARFSDASEAEAAYDALAENGYYVRKVGHYGFDCALRISIGTHEDCEAIARILTDFKGMK